MKFQFNSEILTLVFILFNIDFSFSNTKKLEYNLLNSLDFYQKNQNFSPSTITLSPAIFNSNSQQQYQYNWTVLAHYPTLLGSRFLSNQSEYQIPTFSEMIVFIIWDFEPKNKLQISQYGVNRRTDIVIFISNENYLEYIFRYIEIQNLRTKIGISLQEPHFWVDPYIYNGGQMIRSNLLKNSKSNPKFGGNLRGRHMKGGIYVFFPPLEFTTDKSGKVEAIGTYPKTVESGTKYFNYTVEWALEEDYGELYENGTMSGIFSYVYHEEKGYHFISDSIMEGYLKTDYPSFGSRYERHHLVFFTRHPRVRLKWNSILTTLEIPVWVYFLGTYVLLCCVQGFVMYLKNGGKFKRIIVDSVGILPFSLIMEQGLTDIPKGARYLSCLLLALGLVIGTGYKSTLRTNLAFPVPDPVPRNMKELADSEFKVIVQSLGDLEIKLFKQAKGYVADKIRPRLEFVETAEICLNKAFMEESSVCMSWATGPIDTMIAEELTLDSRIDSMIMSSENLIYLYTTMIFVKNSQFADSFHGIVAGVCESGIYDLWKKEFLYEFKLRGVKNLKEKPGTEVYKRVKEVLEQFDYSVKPMKLKSFYAIFTMLGIGAVFSFCAFIYEIKNSLKLLGILNNLFLSQNEPIRFDQN